MTSRMWIRTLSDPSNAESDEEEESLTFDEEISDTEEEGNNAEDEELLSDKTVNDINNKHFYEYDCKCKAQIFCLFYFTQRI